MLTRILLIAPAFMYNIICAQNQSVNSGISSPIPSVSSYATYKNIPISIQTGTPDISYSLLSVPTNNKFVNIDLGLNYHAGNVPNDSFVSDVGLGWSLQGVGIISRENKNDPDEVFDDASSGYYIKNKFDDVYNFNVPGASGKFRFIRNINDNTFQIVKLTDTTAKIDFTKHNNDATLIVDSFTITTDKGIKYKFDDFSITTESVWLSTDPILGVKTGDKKIRSAFYLTSVLDENNQELAKYSYLRDIKYTDADNQTLEYDIKKLNKIVVKDRAIIDISYNKDETLDEKYDKFSIKDITLNTFNNRFIKKQELSYDYNNTRVLKSFSLVDINNQLVEKTKFSYQDLTYSTTILNDDGEGLPVVIRAKALQNVILPTGGTIQYNFDFLPYSYTDIRTSQISMNNASKEGRLRINNIKYYDQNIETSGSSIMPSKVESYDYTSFDNNAASDYTEGNRLHAYSGIYKNVKVSDGKGYTKYYYKTPNDYSKDNSEGNNIPLWRNYNIAREGILEKKEIYNDLNQKVSEDSYDYTFEEYNSVAVLEEMANESESFYLKTAWIKGRKEKSLSYYGNEALESDYEILMYSDNQNVASEKSTAFNGAATETIYGYAHDKGKLEMIAANMIAIPLETEVKKAGKIISKIGTDYEKKIIGTNEIIVPARSLSYSLQALATPIVEATYDKYDANGKLLQYTTKDGILTAIIWGYNNTEPIAKVEDAKYDDIQNLAMAIIGASNIDAAQQSGNDETALLVALDQFRASLPNYQITTYTYDPLVGVRSVTPPSGIREFYFYDTANRLQFVKDANGKTLKEYQYNYKH